MTLCSNMLGWNAVCGSKPCHSSRTSVLSFPAWFTCLPCSGSGPGPGVSQPGSRAQGANAIHVQRARSEKRSTVRRGQFFYFDNVHSEYCYWIWQKDHIMSVLIGGRNSCQLFHDAPSWPCTAFLLNPSFPLFYLYLIFIPAFCSHALVLQIPSEIVR